MNLINWIHSISAIIYERVIEISNILIKAINELMECSKLILEELDCNDRINIYIGVTGILVAIVIFIAEIISSKKNELYKKLILHKTKITQNIGSMVISLAILWFGNLVGKTNGSIYYLVQFVINFLIVYSMYKTFKTFKIAINLNINEEYLNEQLDLYVCEEIEKLQSNKNKKNIKEMKLRKEYEIYIENSETFNYSSDFFDLNEQYTQVYFDEDTYIKNYNYSLLDYISNSSKINIQNNKKIKESKIEKGTINKPEVILCKNIGDKIDKRFPIAYYKNLDKELSNVLKRIIITDTKKIYGIQNVTKIIEGLFKIAKQDKMKFDNTYQLSNFYEFLCTKNHDDIVPIFVDNIEKTYFELRNNIEYNKSFSTFLVRLLNISRKYNKYENFATINSYITSLYYNRMRVKKADLKMLAYNYANHVFLINSYTMKKQEDYRYYDNIMSNLLVLINGFTRKRSLEAVNILFDNIHLEEIHDRSDHNLSEKEMLKFQFLMGIIHIILCSYKILDDKNLEEIKKLINKIEYKFIVFIDIWDVILCFKKYNKRNSEIMRKIDSMEIYNEEHIYKNSWCCSSLDDNQILKCLLYMFNINFVDLVGIDENDVDKDDKYYFESILQVMSNNEYEKLEEKFLFKNYNTQRVEETLKKAISICEEKQETYKKEGILEESKVNKFKELIIENSEKKTGILKIIDELNKIKYSNEKLKRVFGFSQLIPREIFFKDIGGTEAIASDYGEAFPKGINQNLIDVIEKNSKYTEDSLEKELSSIKRPEDYLVIMSFHQFYTLNFEKEQDYIKINNGKIKVLKTNDSNKIIIVNKESLPEVEFCKFDDSYDENYITGNMFYKLEDCSNNEQLRNKIIKETEWIKQKGNEEEQINYIRQQCEFQAFIAYRIVNSNKIEGLIIDEEED